MSRLKTKTVILIITAFFCFFVFVNGADAGNNGSKSRLSKVKINSTRSLKKNTPDIYAVENELIVKFKKSSSRNNRNRIISKNSLNRIKDISATETKRYKIPAGKNIEELTEELKKNQDIEYAEPNFVAQALYLPNDEYLSRQWGLEKINAYEAWDSTSGDADAIIAVLDSGIDYGHSEFTNQIANGYDFVNSDDMSEDDNGHGTMVSGIISAKCNNNAGIAGTAPNSKIMPVKILDADGFGSYSDIAEGIIFAADNGVKVINLSVGGYGYSQFLQDAVNYAYNKGCVIVAAAGNDNTSEPLYPAGCANVVAVSSINRNGEKSSFSNYGSHIDLCAPGDSIISGAIGNTYKYGSGTSYSAPFVSGIAALVFSKFKTITNAQVISKLYETAQDKGASGKDEIFGNGLPDAGAAVKSEIFNSVEYETFTVVADKLSITMRKLTEEEFFEMKRKTGVYEEGKNYNKIINGFGTGLKPPTEEQWEKIREELMLAEKIEYLDPRQQAPVSFDNSTTDWFPPIGNQGAKGSCVSWATGYYMKTFQEAKEHGWNLSGASWVGGYSGAPTASYQYQIFSPDFLYHLVNDGGDNGSYYSDNINVMKEAGICSWKNKPYNMNDTVSWPSETAWREAPLYRSATGYTTLSVTSDAGLLNLKNLLSGGNLAIIAVDADKYPNMTAEDLWTADNYTSPDYNHGNTVVGYDDNFGPYTEGGETRYGAFKIANQWGKGSWPGDNNLDGFFWISYAAMKTTSCFGQVWYFTNSEGYNPQILAVYKIDHNKRNDCKIKIGTGNPASPDKVKNIYEMSAYADGGPHPFPNNRIAIDVTELKNYLSSKKMFIQVNDSPTIDTGWILDFEIEFYNNYDTAGKADSVFVSASAPVFTINNNNVTLTLSVVDTQTSYNSKKISSSFHTINIDGTNDFLNAELIDSCITESNWGTNNNLDSLYLTYNADTLYIGVTGKFDDASNNYAVCYIDRDFGENTGLKHFLSLTDETENPDAAISNWINASYMGGGGFGAELAVGWDGYSQTGGIRRFESESKYGNMDWLTNAKISGGGQYFECAIPFSEIYNNISLTGKKLGVFVVLTNSAGTHISNQFIPDSALVRQQISVIEIDRNNNGVPDNNIEEDTVYSILIKSPLNNSDTVSQLISVSGTTLNSKSGDSVALYINGIQQSLVFEISSQSQSWSFDAALLTRGNNFISAYLLSGASAIAFDTISVYYYPVDFLCPVNETAEYNIVVSNIIGTDTIYTINSNNCDSVFITASNVLNTDSWSISINPKDTGAYIVLSSPNQNYINSTDTSNIKNYTYGTNAMLKIEVNDSGFNPVGLNYFSDSPVLTFDFSSKNIYSDYGFLRLYYLNTSDSKWYEATHPDSGAASGQEYKLSVGESLLSLPVKHLSHWWFGSEEDSVTAVKGTDIIIDTVLAGETFAAGSVFVMGDTNAGDTLTGFSVSNAGTLNPADIDYVSLFEDGVVLGQYDSGSDTFVDNLNLSGSSWVNNSIDYKFSNNDTGNHFIITVKTKDSADSGADFRLSIPALSIKSFEEDYGPELSINDFDTVIINSISGAASISGPASIEFKYPTVANTKIETSAAEIVVGGTISNAYPGYTVKIYLNNTECSTIILTLSDSTSFSCPVSLRTNPETNYISVYIDSGAGGPGPDDCDTIIVNCSSVRVTFTVDMSGIKNIDTVYLGSADLIGSEWKSYQMQLTDTSSVYSRTFVIPKNKSVTYKFYYTSEGKTVYEYSYFNSYKYLFVFPNNPSYSSVAVRGNWDDWVGSDNLKLDTDGYWRCSKILSASRYEYKFFVNGADWYFDPFNSATNNGNSYLGIDAFPSSSAMREISVSETDVVEYKNWEDTPLNFAGLSVTPIDFDKILIE
ncbi:MAG TPA: S8 family serine peptidase [bacterium]|nr:S8 family serine peptidase [bacterium]